MKIRSVSPEHRLKVYGLLRKAFPGSPIEEQLVGNLHRNNREMLEWVCIQTNKVVGYIAFTNAYNGSEVCGLHLAPLAVSPEFQGKGIGSELVRFALRQEAIRERTVFVLGETGFYRKFGFESCVSPICPFEPSNEHFLAIRYTAAESFTVGYEPEFYLEQPQKKAKLRKKRR